MNKDKSLSPDYAKILFVGVPLSFIVWAVCFIIIAVAFRSIEASIYGSLGLCFLFVVLYLVAVIRHAKWLKAVELDPLAAQRPDNLSRSLTKRETVYIALAMLLFVGVAFVSEVIFNVRFLKSFKIFVLIYSLWLGVDYYRRKRAKNSSAGKSDRAQ